MYMYIHVYTYMYAYTYTYINGKLSYTIKRHTIFSKTCLHLNTGVKSFTKTAVTHRGRDYIYICMYSYIYIYI